MLSFVLVASIMDASKLKEREHPSTLNPFGSIDHNNVARRHPKGGLARDYQGLSTLVLQFAQVNMCVQYVYICIY